MGELYLWGMILGVIFCIVVAVVWIMLPFTLIGKLNQIIRLMEEE